MGQSEARMNWYEWLWMTMDLSSGMMLEKGKVGGLIYAQINLAGRSLERIAE